METELKIRSESQKMPLAALKTLVMPPVHLDVSFRYTDMQKCMGRLKYLEFCKKTKTKPLRMKFRYDYNFDTFCAYDPELLFRVQPESKKEAKLMTESVLNGNKMDSLDFEAIYAPAKKGLETLLKTHVNKLFKQGYGFEHFNVALSFADLDDNIADTSLFYMPNTLTLRIGYNIEKKNTEKLTSWFDKLKKKYEK